MTGCTVEIAQTVLQGLLYGGIYALGALGLSIIFSVIGVLNLAHGDFIMLGGFAGLILSEVFSPNTYGVFALVAIFLVSFLLIAALGGAYEFAFIRPTLNRGYEHILISSILVTVGTAFVIENLGYEFVPAFVLGRQTVFSIPLNQAAYTWIIGGVFINGISIVALSAVAIATLFLYIFSRRSYLGKAMRAITQNAEATKLMGVNLHNVSILTFALGSGFGAIVGVSIGMTSTLSPDFGLAYTISLLSVMILGGTRSYWGPLIGGLIIGFVQDFIGSPFVNLANGVCPGLGFSGLYYWAPASSIIILIIALMIRPNGLAGRSPSTRA